MSNMFPVRKAVMYALDIQVQKMHTPLYRIMYSLIANSCKIDNCYVYNNQIIVNL